MIEILAGIIVIFIVLAIGIPLLVGIVWLIIAAMAVLANWVREGRYGLLFFIGFFTLAIAPLLFFLLIIGVVITLSLTGAPKEEKHKSISEVANPLA